MTKIKRKPDELTKTEKAVLPYLLEGLRHKDIGEKLFVAEKTVRFHTTSIYKKLGVHTQVELIFKLVAKKEK
jgi:DNA-binding NarL/FixJ family response regulator